MLNNISRICDCVIFVSNSNIRKVLVSLKAVVFTVQESFGSLLLNSFLFGFGKLQRAGKVPDSIIEELDDWSEERNEKFYSENSNGFVQIGR